MKAEELKKPPREGKYPRRTERGNIRRKLKDILTSRRSVRGDTQRKRFRGHEIVRRK